MEKQDNIEHSGIAGQSRHSEIAHQSASRAGEILNTPNQERMVIIVCGPPHSGKSVFFHTLKEMLPDHMTYGIRACPDGEGDWSQLGDNEVVQRIRKKGTFDEKTMSWYRKSIKNSKDIPITFVDVGGVISAENESIFKLGTHCIVLCRSDKPEEKARWETFAQQNGLTLIASIDSNIAGQEGEVKCSTDGMLTGSIVGLERGQDILSPTIDAIARHILAIAPHKLLGNDILREQDGFQVLDLNILAKELDLLAKKKIVYDQATGAEKIIMSKVWGSYEVSSLVSVLSDLSFDRTKPLLLDGIAPAFVYSIIASVVPDSHIFIADPKLPEGKIDIGVQKESAIIDSMLHYEVVIGEEKTTLNINIPGGIFDMQKISEIMPPQVPFDKGLIICGRLPIAVSTKIVNHYGGKVPFIALFTPQQTEDAKMKEPCMIVHGEGRGIYIPLQMS